MGECRCPMCKIVYTAKLEKVSICKPWIYCKNCISKVKNKSSDIIPVVIFVTRSESSRISSE